MDIVHPKCITPNFCLPGIGIQNLCYYCQNAIEEAAIQSFQDYGTPDYYIHPDCGGKFSTAEAFIEHVTSGVDCANP